MGEKCEGNFVRPVLVGVPAAADHVRRPVLRNLMLKLTSLHQRLTTCGGRVGAWVLSSTQGVHGFLPTDRFLCCGSGFGW